MNEKKINTEFLISSQNFRETQHLNGVDRIISICKKNKSKTYINLIGGRNLYYKEEFEKYDIELKIRYSKIFTTITSFIIFLTIVMSCSKTTNRIEVIIKAAYAILPAESHIAIDQSGRQSLPKIPGHPSYYHERENRREYFQTTPITF